MKGKRFGVFVLSIICFLLCFNVNVFNASADNSVYLGGFPAGFSLETRGAYINGICDVITEDGLVSPARECGLKIGDIIYEIDEQEVNSSSDIEKCIKNNENSTLELTVLKDGKLDYINITPAKDLNNKYRLGVFIRENINGIGTVTFIKSNRIGSLGHPVIDENGNLLNITGGKLFNCFITGYVKGERGIPGELRGVFARSGEFASVTKNHATGIYASPEELDFNQLTKIELGSAEPGKAAIFTTINGNTPEEYDISIVKVDTNNHDNKNYVIKINDQRLLKTTGGIVQGMSGSPIVQNGKLVGAVTHVFINDPTRGFGIDIKNMINN